jgi:GntR family transcriptional regulator
VSDFTRIVRDSRMRMRRSLRERDGAHGAFEAELLSQGRTPRVETHVRTWTAGDNAAELLRVPAGTPLLARDRRMFCDERLVQLATSFLPLDLVEGTRITQPDTGTGGTWSRLAELGHPVRHVRENAVVKPATSYQAGSFVIAPGDDVLEITRLAEDGVLIPLEVTVMTLDTRCWVLADRWEVRFIDGWHVEDDDG